MVNPPFGVVTTAIIGLLLAACAPAAMPSTPTIEPAPTPASVALHIDDMSWYADSIGGLWFVGSLTNTGQIASDMVHIDIDLLDDEGNVIRSERGYTMSSPILPQSSMPFKTVISEAPTDWARFEARAEGRPFTYDFAYHDFEVNVTRAEATDTYAYTIEGTVTNTGSRPAEFVQVTFTYYDASGRVVGGEFTFADADVLPPGETSTFDVFSVHTAGDVARYEVTVDALLADD